MCPGGCDGGGGGGGGGGGKEKHKGGVDIGPAGIVVMTMLVLFKPCVMLVSNKHSSHELFHKRRSQLIFRAIKGNEFP